MEGFVSVNNGSPFDNFGKYSVLTDNYSLSLRRKREAQNTTIQNQTSVDTRPSVKNQPDVYVGTGYLDPFKDISVAGFDKTIVDTVTTDDESSHSKVRTAALIGGSALAIGAVVLGFMKGNLSKSVANLSGKVMEAAANKIEKIKNKPSSSKFEGQMLSVLQKTHNLAEAVRGTVFNITPLKDVMFEKVVAGKLKLKKPCDKITETFRKLSFSTVKKSYKRSAADLDEMSIQFGAMNERIAKGEFGEGAKSAAEGLSKKLEETNSQYRKSFGIPEIERRNQSVTDKLKGLGNRMYDAIYGNFAEFMKDVDAWTTFLTERMVAPQKRKVVGALSSKRRVITNTPENNFDSFSETMKQIGTKINPNHEPSRELFKTIRELSKNYVGSSENSEIMKRGEIVEKINEQIKKSKEILNSGVYSSKEAETLSELFKDLGNSINLDKKGLVEEMLSTYKEILPSEEYAQIKKSADKMRKSLNKAVKQEGSDYFDKSRDFAAGAALTDVAIGMGVPVATTVIAMSSADTKEKKRSVLLRYGLPLLSGVITSTTCTLKLIAGGKALMLGALVSMIGNRIFERVDKKLLEKSTSGKDNKNNQENKSI